MERDDVKGTFVGREKEGWGSSNGRTGVEAKLRESEVGATDRS